MPQNRPTHREIELAIEAADLAVGRSRGARKRLGRRRTPTRNEQLASCRAGCAEAATPLRSYIGMSAWGGIDIDDELAMKKAMEALRYERRQIDKMKDKRS